MAVINQKTNPTRTSGELPAVGTMAPDVKLTPQDLKDVMLSSIAGKRVLNIFPSVDTGVCSNSVRAFNKKATERPDVTVINVSMDLPFAFRRFCAAEGITKALSMSIFRSDFGAKFGCLITEGGMAGLCSRAVVVLDATGKVLYTEQVPELGQEPNYDAALAAVG
jgi:thiol peroxidase